MFLDLSLEFLRVEFAPMTPAGFGSQRPCLHGVQIAVNGASAEIKTPGSLGFGAAARNEFHHPFPQVQRISFHALKPISLCPIINMKCYTSRDAQVTQIRVEYDDGSWDVIKPIQQGEFPLYGLERKRPDSSPPVGAYTTAGIAAFLFSTTITVKWTEYSSRDAKMTKLIRCWLGESQVSKQSGGKTPSGVESL